MRKVYRTLVQGVVEADEVRLRCGRLPDVDGCPV